MFNITGAASWVCWDCQKCILQISVNGIKVHDGYIGIAYDHVSFSVICIANQRWIWQQLDKASIASVLENLDCLKSVFSLKKGE